MNTSIIKSITRMVFLTILFSVVLAGCTTGNTMKHGNEITDDGVAKIVKNQTTVEEVITMFGPPVNRNTMGNGSERLMFSGSTTSCQTKMGLLSPIMGASTQHSSSIKSLSVTAKNGIVTDYNYNSMNR